MEQVFLLRVVCTNRSLIPFNGTSCVSLSKAAGISRVFRGALKPRASQGVLEGLQEDSSRALGDADMLNSTYKASGFK